MNNSNHCKDAWLQRQATQARAWLLALLAACTGVVSNISGCNSANGSNPVDETTMPLDTSIDTVALLIPDETSATDPRVLLWLDAAQEEGFHLAVVKDSDFIRLGAARNHYRGAIIPDQLHTVASNDFVVSAQDYVNLGGQLMLVYDAGTLTSKNVYAVPKSRFSTLAGVDYGLYDQLRDKTIATGPVVGISHVLWDLSVAPGKAIPYDPATSATVPKPMPRAIANPQNSDDILAVSGYGYGTLRYASFATSGPYSGEVLLTAPNAGIAAGVNAFGGGRALYVNLPLGYLKSQTDGMLLHGFLRYFARNMLGLPLLSSQPSGIGGLVLNWHVDSSAALGPMQKLDDLHVWDKGPFSVHLTAGPDAFTPGDKLGLDVPKNAATRKWIEYFVAKGHQLGSHGGWTHNYFGDHSNETNEAEYLPYLILNTEALKEASGKPIVEYSPPVGNNPSWAIDWLAQNNFVAYYSAGDTGLGPTRVYRNGVNVHPKMWAFPVTPFGPLATLEEFSAAGVPQEQISQWLATLIDFVIEHRTSRLIYFHPPGAANYPQVITDLLQKAEQLRADKKFAWHTMSELAEFYTARAKVAWNVRAEKNNINVFEASHATDLKQQTWLLSKSRYKAPTITRGAGHVQESDNEWLVIADHGTSLAFTANTLAR